MMSFRNNRLAQMAVPTSTAWLLTVIAEGKGRQEGLTQQRPELLTQLRADALVQSAESSNRIGGVTVDAARLRPLVIGDARPRDRSEEEVQGYRRGLTLVHEQGKQLAITSELILKLHGILQAGSGAAGQ